MPNSSYGYPKVFFSVVNLKEYPTGFFPGLIKGAGQVEQVCGSLV